MSKSDNFHISEAGTLTNNSTSTNCSMKDYSSISGYSNTTNSDSSKIPKHLELDFQSCDLSKITCMSTPFKRIRPKSFILKHTNVGNLSCQPVRPKVKSNSIKSPTELQKLKRSNSRKNINLVTDVHDEDSILRDNNTECTFDQLSSLHSRRPERSHSIMYKSKDHNLSYSHSRLIDQTDESLVSVTRMPSITPMMQVDEKRMTSTTAPNAETLTEKVPVKSILRRKTNVLNIKNNRKNLNHPNALTREKLCRKKSFSLEHNLDSVNKLQPSQASQNDLDLENETRIVLNRNPRIQSDNNIFIDRTERRSTSRIDKGLPGRTSTGTALSKDLDSELFSGYDESVTTGKVPFICDQTC